MKRRIPCPGRPRFPESVPGLTSYYISFFKTAAKMPPSAERPTSSWRSPPSFLPSLSRSARSWLSPGDKGPAKYSATRATAWPGLIDHIISVTSPPRVDRFKPPLSLPFLYNTGAEGFLPARAWASDHDTSSNPTQLPEVVGGTVFNPLPIPGMPIADSSSSYFPATGMPVPGQPDRANQANHGHFPGPFHQTEVLPRPSQHPFFTPQDGNSDATVGGLETGASIAGASSSSSSWTPLRGGDINSVAYSLEAIPLPLLPQPDITPIQSEQHRPYIIGGEGSQQAGPEGPKLYDTLKPTCSLNLLCYRSGGSGAVSRTAQGGIEVQVSQRADISTFCQATTS